MKSENYKLKTNRGFSLIEAIFAAAIFAIVSVSIYQGFMSVISLISASRDKVAAINLINSEFELVRNLSYANVGLQGGIPDGVLVATSTIVIDGRNFSIIRTIRNIDDPFDGTIGGSPNDLSPADYKMVQIGVSCSSCKKPIDFNATSNIAPKNLETASTNGALFIRVFDANGNPVPQASVYVENSTLGININETTNNEGLLAIVDVPPASNSYKITTTKNGFTTDKTYTSTVENPNPLKPDASVILQQLTQISFIIDRTSDISLRTITDRCASVANVPFEIKGAKLIGASPDVYKWVGNFNTDSNGYKGIADVEWDVFSFSASGGFYLAGTNPISPISILPDSGQNIDLIMTSTTPALLLVNVKESSTNLPISGATVTLSGGLYNQTLITNKGFLIQSDWQGGAGQTNFVDTTRYFSSDGNIDANNPTGELKLTNSLGAYVASGELVSSIFDTGTSSNWSRVDISPTDQPVETGVDSVRFQIATALENTATTTWSFKGPDGTSATFYTITDNNINLIHNGDRYIRYKIYLRTSNSGFTPNISDFAISFSSSCIPPGQALFSNLEMGAYNLDVSATGFSTQTVPININSNWQNQNVLLSP
ncbi:MAG: carboxypeptidase-like regulatory domain-containing protein [Patescibacteria group bacterium]|nr:carboxypeptidase-like regulatory domain-containing protein [Patescibacteria group bacterium]